MPPVPRDGVAAECAVAPKQPRLTKYGLQTILPNAVASVVEGDFEWDSDKAQPNLEKHGVSFPEAATVFADPAAVYLGDGSGTDRMVVVGLRCEIVCSTLSMSSEADVIASSVHDQPLVLSETFTNPETIHDPVS
jgi:uncharacterized DUF497 family protein